MPVGEERKKTCIGVRRRDDAPMRRGSQVTNSVGWAASRLFARLKEFLQASARTCQAWVLDVASAGMLVGVIAEDARVIAGMENSHVFIRAHGDIRDEGPARETRGRGVFAPRLSVTRILVDAIEQALDRDA